MSVESARSYLTRVVKNQATKKGVASAVAGVLISCFMEAVWPSA